MAMTRKKKLRKNAEEHGYKQGGENEGNAVTRGHKWRGTKK